ncbi:MAG: CCA tRNA nucleotidyltransferase [Lachnospiraceae bacterium]|nr:CCA tRNA nucleotidyltransferase [Lachnospiraceae bacterium]
MKITLPPKAESILNTLQEAGYEAYIVGGCVRDSLLGRKPGDWDITTSALPQTVQKLFRRTVATGIQHGTVTVMLGRDGFEVTTYRSDGTYTDGRHPDSVSFVSSLREDLSRRDFTVNAMAYSPRNGLIDLFGGTEDLKAGIIRAVGNPVERFTEDALRMLRAVRFSAQLGFGIDPETFAAIRKLAPRLTMVSKERIRDEISKLLLSDHPDHFEILADAGITSVIMPRFDEMLATPQHSPFHIYDVGHHTLEVLKATPPTLLQRLTALLHDAGKTEARRTDERGIDHFKGHPALSAVYAADFLREYRYDNKTVEQVTHLVEVHDIRVSPTLPNVRRLIGRVGEDLFPDFLTFIQADNQGKGPLSHQEFAPRFQGTVEAYHEILKNRDPLSLKDLAVGGSDLIAAGIRPGPEMGELLKAMLEDVLEDPSHNTKDYLLGHFV